MAADLERSVLTQEVRSLRGRVPLDEVSAPTRASQSLSDHHEAIAEWCEGRLNRLAPFVEGWDLADGYADAKANQGFCNWHYCDEDRIHLGVGQSHNTSNPHLAAAAFQAAHAAHVQHDPSVEQVFAMANQSLWTSSVEGEQASLFHAILDPTCGQMVYAICGSVFGYVLRPHAWEPLLPGVANLGVDAECKAEKHRQMLMPGDVLVAISNPTSQRSPDGTSRMNRIAEKLLRNTHLSASELSDLASRELNNVADGAQAILIAKRRE